MLSFQLKPLGEKPKVQGEQLGPKGNLTGNNVRRMSVLPYDVQDSQAVIAQQRVIERQKSMESVKNSIRGYTLSNTAIFRPRFSTQKSKMMLSSQMSQKIGSQDSSMAHSSKGFGPTTMILAAEKLAKDAETLRLEEKKMKINRVLEGKTEEEIFAKGLRHFRDAYLLRPPRNIFDRPNNRFGKHFLFFYELKWTYLWKSLQTILSYLFLIQTFLEPQNLADQFSDSNLEQYVYIQEILILTFNLVDNVLGLFLFKSAHKSNFLNFFVLISRFSLIITFFIDFTIFWHTSLLGIRFSAMLRPLWLIQFQDEIYKTLKSIIWSFKQVIDIFLFFVFISIFWGYMGYNLFSEYASQYSDDKYFVFGSIGKSMIGMYTLISMDSYPSILKSIVLDNAYYLIFFMPFVAFNLFFLLFIPVAVIFDNYKNQRAKLMLQDQVILHEGLIFSFYCISYSNEQQFITRDQFFDLINRFYNGCGIRERIDCIYSILNIDIQDKLSLTEFMDVHDLILSSERLDDNSTKFWRFLRTFCNRYLKFEQIGRSSQWNYFILVIVTINTTLVLIYTFMDSTSSDGSTTTFDDVMTNIDLVFNVIYIVDVCIKIIGFGVGNYFSDPWNNFDFFMVCISIVTIFGLNYIYFLKKAKSTKLFKLTKIQKVLKIFRSLRSVKLFRILKLGTDALIRVKKLFHKVVLCVPSLYGLLKTFFLFSFSYAVLGTYLFNTEYNDYQSGSPFDMNDFTSFNTLQGALLALFQVVTQSRWVDYVYGYGYQFSLELSMFYFCFYHMFSILFFMSLLQGVIWEVFGVVEEYFRQHEIEEMLLHHEEELENEQQKDEESCNNIDFQNASEENDSSSASEMKIVQETKNFLRTRGGIRQTAQQEEDNAPNTCTKEEIRNDTDQNRISECDALVDKRSQQNVITGQNGVKQEYGHNQKGNSFAFTLKDKRNALGFDGQNGYSESARSYQNKKIPLQSVQEEEIISEIKSKTTLPFFKKTQSVKQTQEYLQNGSVPKIQLDADGKLEDNKLIVPNQGTANLHFKNNPSQVQIKELESSSPQHLLFTSTEQLLSKDNPLITQSAHTSNLPQVLNQLKPNDQPTLINGVPASVGEQATSVNENSPSANSLEKKTSESTRNGSASVINLISSPQFFPSHTPQSGQIKTDQRLIEENHMDEIIEKEYQEAVNLGLEAEEQERSDNFLVLDNSPKGYFSKETKAFEINDFESKSGGSKKVNSEQHLSLIDDYCLEKQEEVIETKGQDQLEVKQVDKEIESGQLDQTNQENLETQQENNQSTSENLREEIPQGSSPRTTMPSVVKKIINVLKERETPQKQITQTSQKAIVSLNDLDKYLLKRAQVIRYQVDLLQQLNQLENFLQLHDQTSLRQGEKRKQRIVQKHKGLNHFTISKQHALEKMTYLKDNPVNIKYGDRNVFLQATEIQLGYLSLPMSLGNGSNQQQKKNDHHHNHNSSVGPNQQVHPEENQGGNGIKRGRNSLTPSREMQILEIGDKGKQTDSLYDLDEGNLSGSSGGDHSLQLKSNDGQQHPARGQVQLNDQTFLRLNNIFQFLLHLLTNVPVLDSYILIQKLFVIEQCINQVIFGNYDEGQPLNHFKFVFGQPASDKYLVLVKQYEMYESQDFFDEKYDQHHQTQLQEQQQQNPAAHSAIEVKTLTGDGAPWASFTKAFKLEKTIYFIRSLFEVSERSQSDESIAQKLSTAMQFMRGYEFCLEDLTSMITELYTCFVISRSQSEEKPGNAVGVSSSQLPFISFICNRQTGIVLPKKKKKTKSASPNPRNLGRKTSINNNLQETENYNNTKIRANSEPLAMRFHKQSNSENKKPGSSRNIEYNEENNKLLLSKIYEAPIESEIVPNDQDIYEQTGLQTIKPEPGEDNDSVSSPTLMGKLKRTKSPFGVGDKEKPPDENLKQIVEGGQMDSIIEGPRNSITVEPAIIQPARQITQKKKQTMINNILPTRKARLSTFLKSKKSLEQQQEHIVKIYHQVQQFFATHSHLISGLVTKLSTQVTAHIPCYINSSEIDHKNLKAS